MAQIISVGKWDTRTRGDLDKSLYFCKRVWVLKTYAQRRKDPPCWSLMQVMYLSPSHGQVREKSIQQEERMMHIPGADSQPIPRPTGAMFHQQGPLAFYEREQIVGKRPLNMILGLVLLGWLIWNKSLLGEEGKGRVVRRKAFQPKPEQNGVTKISFDRKDIMLLSTISSGCQIKIPWVNARAFWKAWVTSMCPRMAGNRCCYKPSYNFGLLEAVFPWAGLSILGSLNPPYMAPQLGKLEMLQERHHLDSLVPPF